MSGYNNNRGGNGGARLADYRSVADRIDEFWREMRGTKTPARIASELLHADERSIAFRAEVWAHVGGEWVMLANGYAEDMRSSAPNGKCMEVAETSAIGRALANAGYTSSKERASRDEMESYYAAVEAEARENAALASPAAPGATEAPSATSEPAATPQRATQAKRQKVGIVSAAGETRGETIAEAQAKQERLAPVGAERAKQEIHDDAAPLPEPTTIAPRLADQSPAFRKWIETQHAAAENGVEYETIKAAFAEKKEKMTAEQYRLATLELKAIKVRCAEIAALAAAEAELAGDVATELDELSEHERAFLATA